MSGQYRIPGDRFELYGQVRNLTNEPEVGYQGDLPPKISYIPDNGGATVAFKQISPQQFALPARTCTFTTGSRASSANYFLIATVTSCTEAVNPA